jgi:hypothetical protein
MMIREIQYLIREALTTKAFKAPKTVLNEAKTVLNEVLSDEHARCIARNSPFYYLALTQQSLTGAQKHELEIDLAALLIKRSKDPRFDWPALKAAWDKQAAEYGLKAGLVSQRIAACAAKAFAAHHAHRLDAEGGHRRSALDKLNPDPDLSGPTRPMAEATRSMAEVMLVSPPVGVLGVLSEELTKADQAEVKKLVAKELESAQTAIAQAVKKVVEKEVEAMIKSKDIKDDITDITKKVMKRLYKDLSFHHPYIIDRIKV